jgi:hypothetical protein
MLTSDSVALLVAFRFVSRPPAQVEARRSVTAGHGSVTTGRPVRGHGPSRPVTSLWISSGGKPMHTACTLCTLCTLFKTGQTTENKTLEFRSRKGGDGIRPFKLTGIRRESLKLGRKGGAFNVWIKCACAQIKCAWTKLKCANSVHAL